MKLTEILKRNNELENSFGSLDYDVKILSNITCSNLNEILEYTLREAGIPAKASSGDYDNIVQDSQKYAGSDAVVIFWEVCNLVEGFQYKAYSIDDAERENIVNKVKAELNLVFNNLKKTPLVLINEFTAIQFSNLLEIEDSQVLNEIVQELNHYLRGLDHRNVKLVNIDLTIAKVGLDLAFDWRYFYLSKSLYSVEFFKNYCSFIKPYFLSASGKAKKAIIFDCDNTLWKGVLGEDGSDGIDMSAHSKMGAIFHEIQNMAVHLSKNGVIVGLCTKNNFEDIEKIIETHPDFLLKPHLTIVKSNWDDKASNLTSIAKELNIGLDSIVFVDDSDFEINLVKERLPEVKCIQVPQSLFKYPAVLRENLGYFYNLSRTSEDKKKAQMYKQQVGRESLKNEFNDITDYLRSLGLKVEIYVNPASQIERISQMSLKTNQFNLTTKRYSESEIEEFINNENYAVFTISVSDKFGDSGITGLCIVEMNKNRSEARIDSFLMSCRIIGRNIEITFLDFVLNYLFENQIGTVKADYFPTPKNMQVENFFEDNTYELVSSESGNKNYKLDLTNFTENNKVDYIELIENHG